MTGFVCPPPAPQALPLTTPLCVGFGVVTVFRNSEAVWSGDDPGVWLRRFENRAKRDGGKWSVEFMGPLSDERYVRSGDGVWTLRHRGKGFA